MNTIDKIFEAVTQKTEVHIIKKAMKDTKDKRMYLRYRIIYPHLQGHTNRDIAKMEGFCEHTVCIYVRKYNKNGIEGLALKQWVKDNLNVEYSHRGMAEVLYRLKLSFTRPTYTLAKADPQMQEAFKQEFELL